MSISSGSDISSGSSNGRSPDRPIVLKPIVRRGDDQCGRPAWLYSFTGFLRSSTATLPRHKVQMYGLDDFNDPFYDEPVDDAPLASPSLDGTQVQQQNRPSRSLRLLLVGFALSVVLVAALTIRPPSYGALELEFKVSTGAAIDPIRGRVGHATASSTSIVIPDGPSAAETVRRMVGDALAWAIAFLQQLG